MPVLHSMLFMLPWVHTESTTQEGCCLTFRSSIRGSFRESLTMRGSVVARDTDSGLPKRTIMEKQRGWRFYCGSKRYLAALREIPMNLAPYE